MALIPGSLSLVVDTALIETGIERLKYVNSLFGDRSWPARRAHVISLYVDHSDLLRMNVEAWSPEAVGPESKLSALRKSVTMQDRVDAWAALFLLPKVKR